MAKISQITHFNTLCSDDPIILGHWRPAKMPPATLPNVLAGPEMGEESFLVKPLETGKTSLEIDEPILVGEIPKALLADSPLEANVVALDIPGKPAAVDDTEGLINAAMENKEVAWDDCLRLNNVVAAAVELSDVGLTDLLLKQKCEIINTDWNILDFNH